MKNEIIIAMSCTSDWYHYLIVNLYSLLECTKNIKKIYLLLDTDNSGKIPYLNKLERKYNVEFEIIKINNYIDKYLNNNSPNRDSFYTNFCFGKLLLPLLVKENKVIYIDTDAIVRRDISNVWNYDISDYYIAGVHDLGIGERGNLKELNITGKYINSGFIVLNLQKIREENIFSKWFDIINEKKLIFPDQDALNYVCQYKELYISSMYNMAEDTTLPVINSNLIKVFHYAGIKENWVIDRYYGEEWYDAEESFYNEFGWKS